MRTTRNLLRLGLIAFTAAVGACVQRADVATEERVIRDLDKKFLQAVAAKDTMAIANIYAENGEFFPRARLASPAAPPSGRRGPRCSRRPTCRSRPSPR